MIYQSVNNITARCRDGKAESSAQTENQQFAPAINSCAEPDRDRVRYHPFDQHHYPHARAMDAKAGMHRIVSGEDVEPPLRMQF
jgi:hypothetical protein